MELDLEFHYLAKWEKCLTKQEDFIHQERIKFMAKKQAAQKNKEDIHRCL
jgi:hypothetical protein